MADVASLVVGEAAAFDEVADRVRLALPALDVTIGYQAQPRQLPRAVERDPAHHLRLGEVPLLASHLPDPRVGLSRDLADVVGHPGQPAADVAVDPMTGGGVEPCGLEQLAVGVELPLRR